MIPIGDENSGRRGSASVTWILIALNILVFIFFQRFGFDGNRTLALSLIPSELTAGKGILKLLTSQFAHASIGHLAGNMLFLGIFGDNVECRVGHGRYLALYLISGIIGLLAHVGMALALGGAAAKVPLVGASAAISGILAAYLVLFPGNRVVVLLFNFIPTALSAWIVIGFWFALQIVGGLSGPGSSIAYIAHIGGFISSWLWSRNYKRKELERVEKEKNDRLQRGESGGVRWWIANDDR
ncbi:MAG: rhomboid family intramembrane serine protease [Spirochaetes bacterium]|nr:rhomboid family intramembrane serine protease [Spirochaetota bacterium]